jgi:hypothetical protein
MLIGKFSWPNGSFYEG